MQMFPFGFKRKIKPKSTKLHDQQGEPIALNLLDLRKIQFQLVSQECGVTYSFIIVRMSKRGNSQRKCLKATTFRTVMIIQVEDAVS